MVQSLMTPDRGSGPSGSDEDRGGLGSESALTHHRSERHKYSSTKNCSRRRTMMLLLAASLHDRASSVGYWTINTH